MDEGYVWEGHFGGVFLGEGYHLLFVGGFVSCQCRGGGSGWMDWEESGFCIVRTSVISIPMTLPFGPTFCAARKQSNPPPLPRSTTVSPYIHRDIMVSSSTQEKGRGGTRYWRERE